MENDGLEETSSPTSKNVATVKSNMPRKKKPKVNKNKKIGPQKQKEVIHTFLKRSKLYEIRKLSRRISVLNKVNATEQQKAKNERKMSNLRMEIKAMKEIMIDKLTEKLVNVFKGLDNDINKELWSATASKESVDKKLQELSESDDAKKFEQIACLRMFSSKDIVESLRKIEAGKNLKKISRRFKKSKKKNPEMKSVVERNLSDSGSIENLEPQNNMDPNEKHDRLVLEGKIAETICKVDRDYFPFKKEETREEKIRMHTDSFFLHKSTEVFSDEEDEIFSVSGQLKSEQVINKIKRNRMGQRARKKILSKKYTGKYLQTKKPMIKNNQKLTKVYDTKMKQKRDITLDVENLHPSWQAKRKMNTKPVVFTGTKIIFDE